MASRTSFSVSLFYSYSHKDSKHRDRMEQALVLLKSQDNILDDWSDKCIAPGQHISDEVRKRLDETDIVVFLLSPAFIDSDACMEEWRIASSIAESRSSFVRIPIILSECAWKDIEEMADLKALPDDGIPVGSASNLNQAWQQVYEGIRSVAVRIRSTFEIRDEFREAMERTDFASQEHLTLQSTFVFPSLSSFREVSPDDVAETAIDNLSELLGYERVLVHGDQLSGKSALCRHIFLSLNDESTPVVHLDLAAIGVKPSEATFRSNYESQFHGDYSLWKHQEGKTAVLDNLTNRPSAIAHVLLAEESFERVIVATSSDAYHAYFKDDRRFSAFTEVKICPLTHGGQEGLIRKRATLLNGGEAILDGKIDAMENHVNSVIISNKILPRYPFFVLSILQTYEGFMPDDLSVTSFSHCYYVLILTQLIKSGIQKSDAALNACFNFLEMLAFARYKARVEGGRASDTFTFDNFLAGYKENFILKTSILNRMCHGEYGVITETGEFRSPYMGHYFLGKYLAGNAPSNREIIDELMDRSHVWENAVTLMFLIHHTNDDDVVDGIVVRSMVALDNVAPATLDKTEAVIFDEVLKAIPESILSGESPRAGRRKERLLRDHQESVEGDSDSPVDESNTEHTQEVVNDVYRIRKNSEILAQVLRNRYGRMARSRIREIVEAIVDGGLRNVGMFVGSQEDIYAYAEYLHKKHPNLDIDEVRAAVRRLGFLWTMMNIEKVVSSLNTPAIRPIVDDLVRASNSPAHDLIGYFLRLDTIGAFQQKERSTLAGLMKKHEYPFLRKVLSLRTQVYLNTHEVRTQIEQSVCSLLSIKYRPRIKKIS